MKTLSKFFDKLSDLEETPENIFMISIFMILAIVISATIIASLFIVFGWKWLVFLLIGVGLWAIHRGKSLGLFD